MKLCDQCDQPARHQLDNGEHWGNLYCCRCADDFMGKLRAFVPRSESEVGFARWLVDHREQCGPTAQNPTGYRAAPPLDHFLHLKQKLGK